MADPKLTKIASVAVDTSPGKRTPFQIPGEQGHTFRFVDVAAYLEKNTLDVYSSTELPKNAYACISYPWWGLDADSDAAVIDVYPLKPRDATSVRMLQIACATAQKLGCQYLWMDKLCVRQDEPENKAPDQLFQVKHMYDVYSSCKVCLVFAGGMKKLPKVEDKTRWIDRAWTLQEALAPKDVRVLFEWTLGNMRLQPLLLGGDTQTKPIPIQQVEPGVGMSDLKRFLECSSTVANQLLPPDDESKLPPGQDDGLLIYFLASYDGQFYATMRLLSAMSRTDDGGRLNAIWRCLIIRQAKYKEDLIFSSMGVMGVNVIGDGIKEGTNYNDIEVMDLVIRLVKELIKKGFRAEWLGISPTCGPAPGYSSLPNMPLERSVGHGYRKDEKNLIWPVYEADNDNWWWLRDSPSCIVHENADLSFTAKAVAVRKVTDKEDITASTETYQQKDHPNRLVHPITKEVWALEKEVREDSKLFAVYVGTKVYYVSDLFPEIEDADATLLMIVEEIEPGRFKNTEYVYGDVNLVNDWKERRFRIGG